MNSLKRAQNHKEINYRHVTYTSSSETNDLNDYQSMNKNIEQSGSSIIEANAQNPTKNIITNASYLHSHSSGYNSGNPNGSYSSYSTSVGNDKVYSSSSGIYATGSSYDLPKDDYKEQKMLSDDLLAQEVLAKCGPSFTYQRKDYLHDISSMQQQEQQQQQQQKQIDIGPDTSTTSTNNQLNTTYNVNNSTKNNNNNINNNNSNINNSSVKNISRIQQQSNNLNHIYQDINTTTNSESNEELNINNKNSSLNDNNLNKSSNNLNDTANSSQQEQTCNVNIIKIEPPPTLYSASSVINQDPDPIRIVKPNSQNIIYKQQVNIRYLQPPTPPPPAPIIIREKQLSRPAPQPPIIIRYAIIEI